MCIFDHLNLSLIFTVKAKDDDKNFYNIGPCLLKNTKNSQFTDSAES
jgi:hypothetical protein